MEAPYTVAVENLKYFQVHYTMNSKHKLIKLIIQHNAELYKSANKQTATIFSISIIQHLPSGTHSVGQ